MVVGSIADHSGLNPFVTMERVHHVSELLATLKRGMSPGLCAHPIRWSPAAFVALRYIAGVHRVMVLDDSGKVECLISQSDILCLLEECMKSAYPRLAEKVQLLALMVVPFWLLPSRSREMADCRGVGLDR